MTAIDLHLNKALKITTSFLQALRKLSNQEKIQCQDFLAKVSGSRKGNGISSERLHGDPRLWSMRVNDDMRAIMFQSNTAWLLVYVGHHQTAYRWAKNKRFYKDSDEHLTIEQEHFESVVTIQEHTHELTPALFAKYSMAYFQQLGFPSQLIPFIYELRTEDHLMDFMELYPGIGEILLELHTGKLILPDLMGQLTHQAARTFLYPKDFTKNTTLSEKIQFSTDSPISNPESIQKWTQKELIENPPIEQEIYRFEDQQKIPEWILFLGKDQQDLIKKHHSQPLWIQGAAGTGKSIVGIHRARYLAKRNQKVLWLGYSPTLTEYQSHQIDTLCDDPNIRQKIDCWDIISLALHCAQKHNPKIQKVLNHTELHQHFDVFLQSLHPTQPSNWLHDELDFALVQWGLIRWQDYQELSRLGREKALDVKEKRQLWSVFFQFRQFLFREGMVDLALLCYHAIQYVKEHPLDYQAVIVDEAQDLEQSQLAFIAALAQSNMRNLMMLGDPNQQIYPHKSDFQKLGMDFEFHTLHKSYRSTERIKNIAETALFFHERHSTTSLEIGSVPTLIQCDDRECENQKVLDLLKKWHQSGIAFEDMVILHRHPSRAHECKAFLDKQYPDWKIQHQYIFDVKGLEFEAVIMLGLDIFPFEKDLQSRSPVDQIDLFKRERKLLYVALTRARKELALTWVGEKTQLLQF